ncbi:peptide methionine sulfoxide reductase [Lipomyces tetrasporus]
MMPAVRSTSLPVPSCKILKLSSPRLRNLRTLANSRSSTVRYLLHHPYHDHLHIYARAPIVTFVHSFVSGLFFSTAPSQMGHDNTSYPMQKNEQEWHAILTPQQFRVLREKGTERPFTGEYDHHHAKGVYHCAGCNAPLYQSSTKFDSGCGWPAFFDAIPGSIKIFEDRSLGMVRTEMVCANCGGHLGHIFKGEGYKTPTDERHCVNSISLKFKEGDS